MSPAVSVSRVKEVMLDDPILIQHWSQLADALGLRKADYIGKERAFKNGTAEIGELIERIIWCWSSRHDNNTPCTIGVLCDKIRRIDFHASADTIEEKFGRAASLNIDSAEGTPKLKQKWWPEKKPLVNSFVERKLKDIPLVDKLHDMLNESQQRAVISQQACISGLGGIGKTTLAKWFAHRWEDEFDHIIWLDCGEDALGSSVDRLWEHIYAHHRRKEDKPSSITDIARQCFKALLDSSALIIYDNAEAYIGNHGVQPALPSPDQCPNTKCLITSRWTSWGSTAGHGVILQLPLGTFAAKESIIFLETNLIGVQYKQEELKELSDLLGHLPLALQIGLAHVNQYYANTSNGLASYINTLAKSPASLVQETTDVDGYNKGLLSILNETKEKVRQNKPLAWSILSKMAYLPCDSVGVRFLASVEGVEDYPTALAAISILQNHSLVTRTTPEFNFLFSTFPEDKHYVSVHRLLKSALKILNASEATTNLSKVLGSPLVNASDAWYKWESFLVARSLPELAREVGIAKCHVYQGITLHRLLRDKQYDEALLLLEVYKDVMNHMSNYHECQHAAGHGFMSRWWLINFGCAQCNIQKAGKRWIICAITGLILHLQGNYAEALKRFESSKTPSTTTSAEFETFICFPACHDLWNEFEPWNFKVRNGLLRNIFIWRAMTLDKLERRKEAIESLSGICISKDDRRIVLKEWFGCTCRIDLIVPEDCSDLYLERPFVSLESSINWMRLYPNKSFSSYDVSGIKLLTEDGSIISDIDYHVALHTKSEGMLIDCHNIGDTLINFHISEMWHSTQKLSLAGCKVTWDTTNEPQSKLERLSLVDLANDIPKSLSLNTYFPNLRRLEILMFIRSNVTLPVGIFPPFLKELTLRGVKLEPEDNAGRLLEVKTLTFIDYRPSEIYLSTTQVFKVEEKLKIAVDSPIQRGEAQVSDDCQYFSLILENSKYTDILENWDDTVVNELKLHGVDVHTNDHRKIFNGKTQTR